jgi:hypothetical protein
LPLQTGHSCLAFRHSSTDAPNLSLPPRMLKNYGLPLQTQGCISGCARAPSRGSNRRKSIKTNHTMVTPFTKNFRQIEWERSDGTDAAPMQHGFDAPGFSAHT